VDGAVQYPPAGALRACAPYWARTKGKHEHGVGYVKHNAVAGHRFGSWSELEAHLVSWMRKIHARTARQAKRRWCASSAKKRRTAPSLRATAIPTAARAPGAERL